MHSQHHQQTFTHCLYYYFTRDTQVNVAIGPIRDLPGVISHDLAAIMETSNVTPDSLLTPIASQQQ